MLLLAVAGLAAVLVGTVRSALRLLGRGVEAYVAGQLADTRARRGDLTGMAEARDAVRRASRARLRGALVLAGWTAALVTPLLVPWTRSAYAACAALWILHWSRERRR